eukprot:CAMPEP_0197915248 /NCGR_PEP_ID=MMETSP1439-20131203/79889_1 /TAXON_ID=66791 /ORGANISM="Gonyaulax spinifera, Strain CCMP409" /LENGTH=105 /DNA_ID=CAMNT_0043537195 /DNA_START=162 /DNA_END=475 /DNA_ORIENTATION=+
MALAVLLLDLSALLLDLVIKAAQLFRAGNHTANSVTLGACMLQHLLHHGVNDRVLVGMLVTLLRGISKDVAMEEAMAGCRSATTANCRLRAHDAESSQGGHKPHT